jgi:CRP/FNR family cyclic AMP-dependent transcriptional regulator
VSAAAARATVRAVQDGAILERLRRLPLFARLSEDELSDLAARIRPRLYKRAEVIFRKDDPGTHLYLVLEGAVKIALPGEFGQEALVAIMRPGDFFGELALFDRSPRSATAVALDDTRAALLAGEDFIAFLERHPSAVRLVLETLARTIRRLSDRVEHLTFLDVPSRVAKYLLDLAQANAPSPQAPPARGRGTAAATAAPTLELSLTQDELAAFVGASRVSVNRVLGDLERREIVSIKRRRISIKDPERLAKEIRL